MMNFPKVLAAGLIFAGGSLFSAGAMAGELSIYRPAQGLSYPLGSKLAVGYFLQNDGVCTVNLFVAENTGDNTGPAASRLRFKLPPAEHFILDSVEGQALELKCGADAATLEVERGSAPAKFVSR